MKNESWCKWKFLTESRSWLPKWLLKSRHVEGIVLNAEFMPLKSLQNMHSHNIQQATWKSLWHTFSEILAPFEVGVQSGWDLAFRVIKGMDDLAGVPIHPVFCWWCCLNILWCIPLSWFQKHALSQCATICIHKVLGMHFVLFVFTPLVVRVQKGWDITFKVICNRGWVDNLGGIPTTPLLLFKRLF